MCIAEQIKTSSIPTHNTKQVSLCTPFFILRDHNKLHQLFNNSWNFLNALILCYDNYCQFIPKGRIFRTWELPWQVVKFTVFNINHCVHCTGKFISWIWFIKTFLVNCLFWMVSWGKKIENLFEIPPDQTLNISQRSKSSYEKRSLKILRMIDVCLK